MDKWLGDGGMPLLGELGVDITGYEVAEDGKSASVRGTWTPAELACNPQGVVQGGVYGTVADAAMTFATLAALDKGETCSLLDMQMAYHRGARRGDTLEIEAELARMTRRVAFCRARVLTAGAVAVEATGTNLLRRREP